MKNKRYLYAGLFLVSFIILCVVFWSVRKTLLGNDSRDYPQIAEDGILRIATDYNTVGYYVSGDTIAGFNHDLLQLIQAYTPLKVEVVLEASLEKAIAGLEAGQYDVIARNIPITSDLRASLNFTDPIVQNKQVLIQRKKEYNDGKEPIRSHLDLANKTLYVAKNSPAILRIKNLSHEIGDTIYIREDDAYEAEQLAMMVASMEIDYAVCDEQIAGQLAKSMPEIDYSTLIGFTHLEAWAVRKNSLVLLDSLNSWIDRAEQTSDYSKIYKKYFK